ncbi:MAG: lysyl-tRNA synthetase class 2 [Gammaproteobacteria bacterium]|jgi:lysyl-tRNA synthetase class 2
MTNETDTGAQSQLIAQRRAKLKELQANGQAYPNDFRRDSLAGDLHIQFANRSAEDLVVDNVRVAVAGRMLTQRVQGKTSFAHVQDMSGQIQLFVKRDNLPEETYAQFKKWDLGDIIGAVGTVFRTQKGELSVMVDSVRALAKSLRPLPEKFHGLTDTEARYRQRYLDLIMNESSRKVFETRSKIIECIRVFFRQRRFVEVETPMMQPIPGGATARPFVTHHNALDMQLYLRIAPELYLKRLVVGGMEKVYEINRNFRNEGLSTRHNPEFTMLEFYEAFADYEDLMALTEELLHSITQEVIGTATVIYQGETLDFSGPFNRMTMKESIVALNPDIGSEQLDNLTEARALARQLNVPVDEHYGLGKIQTEIFEKTVESRLIQPTFITQYPAEVSPLARRNDVDPFVTDRFEFFAAGREIANGFSELNDPDDQAARFQLQVDSFAAGDNEAMHYDADYIQALEYGMPPTAGEGIGIDRLVMLLTDSASIRDVLLFPQMRPTLGGN